MPLKAPRRALFHPPRKPPEINGRGSKNIRIVPGFPVEEHPKLSLWPPSAPGKRS